MRGLSPTQLLEVWEQGVESTAIERGLLLLSCCLPESGWSELASVPIGRRNVLLLELRAATFGNVLNGFAVCPACSGQLEFAIHHKQLALNSAEKETGVLQLEDNGRSYPWRLPDSTDLYAAAACESVDEARRSIASRCIKGSEAAEFPAGLMDSFEQQLSETDPAADIALDLSCPDCGQAWQLSLDVVSFFWRELQAAARRLALEVDALARTYGWSEAEIVGMSSSRRNLYLELVG
jgi:hypothetical protein